MRVMVVAVRIGSARKVVSRSGDDVLIAYDPDAGGALERARDIATVIQQEWGAVWRDFNVIPLSRATPPAH